MKFTIYQESRVGQRRNNEDRIAYSYSRDALLTVVADGMGGHHHGEVAAQLAVQYLMDVFQREAKPSIDDPFLFLQRGFNNAHEAIIDYSVAHGLSDSPRTTCVACIVQDNVAYWAHAGDSRLYHLRRGRVASVTKDHSRVQLMLDDGLINEAQAAIHPDRNKIYTCLGGFDAPEITFSRKTPMEAGDLLVLCTDGLWSSVSGDTMNAVLGDANLMQAVPVLMNMAEQRGGPHGDNLSMIAVRWEDSYSDDPSSSIQTQAMAQGEVHTQMGQLGPLGRRQDDGRPDLSDDEIERAIAEIRSAIDKYAKP